MMYQACSRPGRNPRQQRAMLTRESTEQSPRLTQTVTGVLAKTLDQAICTWPKLSCMRRKGLVVERLACYRWEKDGDEAKEDVAATHDIVSCEMRCLKSYGRRKDGELKWL